VVEDNIDDAVDFWPVRTDAVDATLAMDVPPTADYVDNLGVASKGLPVIEYLLFDPEGGNAAVLAALQAPDGVGDHRCAFVAALAADVATQSTALRTAWDPAAGNFVAELANAGESSMTFATVQMALDDIVNESIFALQDITDAKLGTPLGSTSGGVAQPEDVESRFSDNSWADIGSDLEGVAAVYLGAPEGFGLTHLVAPEAPDLDQAIRDQIQLCQTSVAGAVDGPPVRTQIVDDPMAVEAIREQVRELRRLFAVDLANLLAVTVTLNDNDGD
jgi:predicted lipoprotein